MSSQERRQNSWFVKPSRLQHYRRLEGIVRDTMQHFTGPDWARRDQWDNIMANAIAENPYVSDGDQPINSSNVDVTDRLGYFALTLKGRMWASVTDRDMDRFPEQTEYVSNRMTAQAVKAVSKTKQWVLHDCKRAANEAAKLKEDDNSDESVNMAGGNTTKTTPEETAQRYYYLIEQLPFCDAMTAGFETIGDNKNWCYCPFSKNLSKWRKIFEVDDIPTCDMKGHKSFTPESLRDHLESKATNGINSCVYHAIVKKYISHRYPHNHGRKPAPTTQQANNADKHKQKRDDTSPH